MRKVILSLSVLIILKSFLSYSQSIPEKFFGQNAWYTRYTFDGQSVDANDYFVKNINKVKSAGSQYIRIGGAAANLFGNTPGNTVNEIKKQEILFLVKRIRSAGMEPIIQVPYPNEGNNNSNLSDWANNAADIVEYINITHVGSIGGRVDKWIIANEPDKNLGTDDGINFYKIGYNYNANNINSPGEIAKYIKQFAIKMREKDLDIDIIAPELSWNIHHFFFGGSYQGLDFSNKGLLENGSPNDISGLIGSTDVFGNSVPFSVQGKPFIDFVSFHYYNPASSKSIIINEIHDTSDNWKVKKGLINLKNACTSSSMISKRTSSFPLKVAITEANVDAGGAISNSNFISSQWWADFMGMCLSNGNVEWINMWSSFEDAFGFIDYAGTMRSSYWHFKFMTDYFSQGEFFANTSITDVTSGSQPQNIKAFACKNGNQIVVMIMNQSDTYSPKYVVNLNGTATASNPLKISFNTGVSGGYADPVTLEAKSTVVLIFDCQNGTISKKWIYKDSTTPTEPQLYSYSTNSFSGLSISPALNTIYLTTSSPCTTLTFSGASEITWFPNENLEILNATGTQVKICMPASGETDFYFTAHQSGSNCISVQSISIDNGPVVGTDPGFSLATTQQISNASCPSGIGSVNIGIWNGNAPYYLAIFNNSNQVLYQETNNSNNRTIGNLPPGNYTFTIIDGNNNYTYGTFDIGGFGKPAVNAGSDKYVCSGSTITLNSTVSESGTYSWSGNGLNSSSSSPSVTVPVNTTNSAITYNYDLTFTNNFGCSNPDQVSVIVYPEVNAGADRTIERLCLTKLSASPVIAGATYQWYNSSNQLIRTGSSFNITPKYTTTYKLVVTYPGGCQLQDFVTVNVTSVRPSCVFEGKPGHATRGCDIPDYVNKTITRNETIYAKNYVVKGKLTITKNAILKINESTLTFDQDGVIEIMPGGSLEIENSTFQGCGGNTWVGIDMKGSPRDNGYLTIKGSYIINALIAVKTDKAKGLLIADNVFAGEREIISLSENSDFTIKGNKFYFGDVAVKTQKSLSGLSEISGNEFIANKTSLAFDNDNHSGLQINCNTFNDYEDYGILSTRSVLKDQGSLYEGAGNEFVSASTLTNNQLNHSGNQMKYYYDPSMPISINSSLTNVTAQPSQNDKGCQAVAARLAGNSLNDNAENEIPLLNTNYSALIGNVPNPASGKTSIVYSLSSEVTKAEIKIMNMYGQLINTYPIDIKSSQLEIDCSALASGIYFYALTVDGNVEGVKRMVITK